MQVLTGTAGISGDLFGTPPISRNDPVAKRAVKRRLPLELQMASALCRQMRRKRAPHEKRRIAHLICLNLLSMLKCSDNTPMLQPRK